MAAQASLPDAAATPITGAPIAMRELPITIRYATFFAAVAAALLSACADKIESEIHKRFAEKYDRPLCVDFRQPFPATFTASPQNKENLAWLSSLEHAGLLEARELPPDRRAFFPDRRYVFSLTDAGRKQITPENRFCYGRAEIVEVIDYTEPSSVGGVSSLRAQARLRRHVQADWARDPALAEWVKAGDQTVEMLLVKKAKGGWSPAY